LDFIVVKALEYKLELVDCVLMWGGLNRCHELPSSENKN
jgi:hypothetical protein